MDGKQDPRIHIIHYPDTDERNPGKVRGLTVDGRDILLLANGNDDLTMPGLRSFYAISYIEDRVAELARGDLIREAQGRIEDRSFYNLQTFWRRAVFTAGIGVDMRPMEVEDWNLESMADGIVDLSPRREMGYRKEKAITLHYSLTDDSLSLSPGAKYSGEVPTIMEYLYGEELLQEVALLHHREGRGHPVYVELVRINAFLEGKHSARVLFPNSGIAQIDYRERVTAGDFLREHEGKLIAGIVSYDSFGQWKEQFPESLLYRKERFDLNQAILQLFECGIQDEAVLNRRRHQAWVKSIQDKIPQGKAYCWYTARIDSQWSSHPVTMPSRPTLQSLSRIPKVCDFLTKTINDEHTLTVRKHVIGSGEESDIPLDLY